MLDAEDEAQPPTLGGADGSALYPPAIIRNNLLWSKMMNKNKGIAIGLAIGVALGVALNNIAVGIALGIVFGVIYDRKDRESSNE